MQATPLFLGACALASIAGVLSGASIDTRPIQRAGIGMSEIARPAIDFASDSALSEQVALPDHYALDTPEGRIDVAELSSRGIYAQRRFGWREARWTAPPEQAFTNPPRSEWAERGTELQPAEAHSQNAPLPPQPEPPAADGEENGGPRLIDVQANLPAE